MSLGPNTKLKFLVLDDDETSYLFLKKAIDNFCHATVHYAENIEQAEEIATSKNIHMMFIDHYLRGEEDGLEFIQTRRKNSDTTPIAVISGNGDPVEVQLAFEAGADDFLPKPIELESLKQTISKYLKH